MTLELFLLLSSLLSLGIYIALDKWEKESQKALVDQPYKDKFFLALDARILQLIEALHQRDRCIQIMREASENVVNLGPGTFIPNTMEKKFPANFSYTECKLALMAVEQELNDET